MPGKKFYFSKN